VSKGKDDKGRFTKGNLFSLYNCGGRPPKYKTAEELAQKIAEYLEYEDSLKRPDAYSGSGKGIYTLSGCALYLGFNSKSSMDDQMKRSAEFSNVIERFKLFLTHWNEQKLYWAGTFHAANFWLKNFGGYKEEATINQNQKIEANYGGNDVPTSRQAGGDTQGDQSGE